MQIRELEVPETAVNLSNKQVQKIEHQRKHAGKIFKKFIDSFVSKQKRIQNSSQFSRQKEFTSSKQIHRMQMNFMKKARSLKPVSKTYKASNWLFDLKVKHQILILTLTIIMIVTGLSIALNQIHLRIFGCLLGNGFNQILNIQNANFQASIMIKYMSLTRNYFYNNQQILLAINQLYNHALKSKYQADKGIECPLSRVDGKYPTYFNIDSFCYVPYGSADLQTFKNTPLNQEFVKLTSTLNEFILCFNFHLSYKINNYIQLNLDNEDEMISVYPQVATLNQYSPRQRPAFLFQQQQYNSNITKIFYITQYFKRFNNRSGTQYLQSLTLSLLNGTQFQGMVGLSIQFNVFDQIFQSFPDVNIALVDADGTLLYKQTQFEIYNEQQFIYNQSSTGYNYIDWLDLSSNQDYTKQIFMNNTLFPDQLKINIKKFDDLPYYFIVYNNLTYENQIQTIQLQILNEITAQSNIALGIEILIVFSIVIACYIRIERLVKPITKIQKLIYSHIDCFKDTKKLVKLQQSRNILNLLLLVIYFKHSQLKNLSFNTCKQCEQMEALTFPTIQYTKSTNDLIQYLQYQQMRIKDKAEIDWLN